MRVFLTGATGFIGSAIVPELLAAGHQVLGLTRSEAGGKALAAAGAQAHFGNIEDLASLRAGAAQAEAVIHCAFDHDFSNFVANCEKDRGVIGALAEALEGSDRPLVITSGVGLGIARPGEAASEDVFDAHHPIPRVATELAGQAALERGLNVSVVRLPQVHDTTKAGLISPAIDIARAKGISPYVGEGKNRWSAAHVSDAAKVYRLALEKGLAGSRYHAVGEEGVTFREIAETVGKGLGIPVVSLTPEEAAGRFGRMTAFASFDITAASALTQARLNWRPTGPGLLADLAAMDYAAV